MVKLSYKITITVVSIPFVIGWLFAVHLSVGTYGGWAFVPLFVIVILFIVFLEWDNTRRKAKGLPPLWPQWDKHES
jgi:hypothetical protein